MSDPVPCPCATRPRLSPTARAVPAATASRLCGLAAAARRGCRLCPRLLCARLQRAAAPPAPPASPPRGETPGRGRQICATERSERRTPAS
eukprot:830564-Prymnesium_polylepis.1